MGSCVWRVHLSPPAELSTPFHPGGNTLARICTLNPPPLRAPRHQVSPAAWNYTGNATGEVVFTIESPPAWGTDTPRKSTVGSLGWRSGEGSVERGAAPCLAAQACVCARAGARAQLVYSSLRRANRPLLSPPSHPRPGARAAAAGDHFAAGNAPTRSHAALRPSRSQHSRPGARAAAGRDHPDAAQGAPRAVGPAALGALPARLHPPRQPGHQGVCCEGGWDGQAWDGSPRCLQPAGLVAVMRTRDAPPSTRPTSPISADLSTRPVV